MRLEEVEGIKRIGRYAKNKGLDPKCYLSIPELIEYSKKNKLDTYVENQIKLIDSDYKNAIDLGLEPECFKCDSEPYNYHLAYFFDSNPEVTKKYFKNGLKILSLIGAASLISAASLVGCISEKPDKIPKITETPIQNIENNEPIKEKYSIVGGVRGYICEEEFKGYKQIFPPITKVRAAESAGVGIIGDNECAKNIIPFATISEESIVKLSLGENKSLPYNTTLTFDNDYCTDINDSSRIIVKGNENNTAEIVGDNTMTAKTIYVFLATGENTGEINVDAIFSVY